MAERFGVDRTKAMGTRERKDNMRGNEEMERKDLSVTYQIEEFEELGKLKGSRRGGSGSLNIEK